MDILKKIGIICQSSVLALTMSLADTSHASERNIGDRQAGIESIIEDTRQGTDDEDTKDYRVYLSVTRSFPKLKQANQEIKDVGKELRTLSKEVKDFETWDDVYTGMLSLGIEKNIDLFGISMWPGAYVSYGSGSVRTSQKNIPTVLGLDLDYDFKQRYTMHSLAASLSADVLKYKKMTMSLGGALSFNMFESKTDLDVSSPDIGMQRQLRGTFKDNRLGKAVYAGIDYRLDDRWSLLMTARYDWLRFKGDAKVDEKEHSAFGTVSRRSKNRTVVDVTGPSVGAFITYRF